jgi:hypothetical protein
MKWTKARKKIYMRKYMRKYYKRHRKKILARSKVLRNLRELKLRIRARTKAPAHHHREKTVHAPPTLQAHKVASKAKSREKIQIPLPEKQGISVPAAPWSPTCQICGMLRLNPREPCRHCGPGSEKHLPPSPPQSQRIASGRPAYPRVLSEDEDDQIVAKEAGF